LPPALEPDDKNAKKSSFYALLSDLCELRPRNVIGDAKRLGSDRKSGVYRGRGSEK
jgi:hypothetical protein